MTGASGSWGCCHIDGYTTQSKDQLIGVLIAIAYSFLLLRLDNCVFFSIFSVTYKLLVAEFM